jgi:predicted Rossmann fold flavoprotein
MKVAIIGGGAAGFFSAINIKERFPHFVVYLFERSQRTLAKVAISGGGRCNVTCDLKTPEWLIENYPRGGKRLLGPLHLFHPQDTISWFEERGVAIKREEDGRHFPVTDSSETVITCLTEQAKNNGVILKKGFALLSCTKTEEGQFSLIFDGDEGNIELQADRVILATGSHPSGYKIASELGHAIVPPVPSLFAFNCPTSPLLDLPGITSSFVKASLPEYKMEAYGPLLLTHQGFSGPAILRLSAFGARELHRAEYKAKLVIDWLEEEGHFIPKNLRKRLGDSPYALSTFFIEGKTTNKSEFVTAGGVSLDEVNFQTMESRIVKGLYFAGEILNIDGLTGGFNFQNCWIGGWIISQEII